MASYNTQWQHSQARSQSAEPPSVVVPGMDTAAEVCAGSGPHLGSPEGREQAAVTPPHLVVDLLSADPPFPAGVSKAGIDFAAYDALRQQFFDRMAPGQMASYGPHGGANIKVELPPSRESQLAMRAAADAQILKVTVGGHMARMRVRLDPAPHAPPGTVVVHLKGLPNALCVVGITRTLMATAGCQNFEVIHEAQAQAAPPACCPGAAPGLKSGEVVAYVKVENGGTGICGFPPRFTIGTAKVHAEVKGALASPWRIAHLSGNHGQRHANFGGQNPPAGWHQQQQGRDGSRPPPPPPRRPAAPIPPRPQAASTTRHGPARDVLPGFARGQQGRGAQPGPSAQPSRRTQTRAPGGGDRCPDVVMADSACAAESVPAKQAAGDVHMAGESDSDEPQPMSGPSSPRRQSPARAGRQSDLQRRIADGQPLRLGGLVEPLTEADTRARTSGDRSGLGRQAANPMFAAADMQTLAAWAAQPLPEVQKLVADGGGAAMSQHFHALVDKELSCDGSAALSSTCCSFFEDSADTDKVRRACAVVSTCHPEAWQAPGGTPGITPPEAVRRAVGALLQTDSWQEGLIGLDGQALAAEMAPSALQRITAAETRPLDTDCDTAAQQTPIPPEAATPAARGGTPQ